jgi:hypothetical protein
MRLSILRAVTIAAGAAIALAACSSGGTVPPSAAAYNPMAANNPMALNNANAMLPLALTKCDTSPPQYDWIFEGACDKFTLKPSGSPFKLATYKDISLKGMIGKNSLKKDATVALADATDSSDVKAYKGIPFPKAKIEGKDAFAYAAAINQGTEIIKPIVEPGHPVLQYVITDSKGFSGSSCKAAALESKAGKFEWVVFPGNAFKPKGHTLTVSQYTAPANLVLAPKTPLYVAVACY